MLMLPQHHDQPASLPNANPDYNFIFSDQKPRRRFSLRLPGGNSLTKLAILIITGGAVLGILIIVLSSFFGPKVNTKEITDVVARAQEITRVSDSVTVKSHDLNTANLSSTTSAALTSQQGQLTTYLKKNRKKVSPKETAIYQNKKTDDEIQSADQNNRLSEYYASYLKKNLADYQASIKTAYDTAGGPNIKSTLDDFSKSNQIILSTQQIATASSQ
jgi:hypothetical protein